MVEKITLLLVSFIVGCVIGIILVSVKEMIDKINNT